LERNKLMLSDFAPAVYSPTSRD